MQEIIPTSLRPLCLRDKQFNFNKVQLLDSTLIIV